MESPILSVPYKFDGEVTCIKTISYSFIGCGVIDILTLIINVVLGDLLGSFGL